MKARTRADRAAAERATARQVVVLAAVLAAGSEKAAAHRLGLSHSTVKDHLANARLKVDGVADGIDEHAGPAPDRSDDARPAFREPRIGRATYRGQGHRPDDGPSRQRRRRVVSLARSHLSGYKTATPIMRGNKSHLLDLMAERLLDQVDLAPVEAATWQDRLRRLLASFQAVAAAHPATALLLWRPFVSPAALRVSEALLATLQGAGFDAGQSVCLLQVITGMVLGPAINRATWAAASRDRPPDADRQRASMEWLSSSELPDLAGATDQFMDWSAGADADRLAIELLVGGLEALAAQPNRGGASSTVSRE